MPHGIKRDIDHHLTVLSDEQCVVFINQIIQRHETGQKCLIVQIAVS